MIEGRFLPERKAASLICGDSVVGRARIAVLRPSTLRTLSVWLFVGLRLCLFQYLVYADDRNYGHHSVEHLPWRSFVYGSDLV